MGIMGLQAIYKGPNTNKKHPQHRIWPYLLRKLPITRPNHVWCSDITYIPVKNGFLYLVAIMDWATRIEPFLYPATRADCRHSLWLQTKRVAGRERTREAAP
jgi:transposase InsO family protein